MKTTARKSDSGMKRRTIPAEERHLRRIAQGSFQNSNRCSFRVSQIQNISVETVRRRLRENNLIAYIYIYKCGKKATFYI